ncbi:hypothetical protein NHH03_23555 [Stieleria sp. TO1_6]|uniref:hypothetical protein n=1 Tax=Stieleria tagensis TaxID=2956795 RepID=UPI00209B39EA|nr:hypothetical protein [Stieleria tagensis]MCO8124734.1 hypothetical protein [Stieleria tagensis]
MRNSQSQINATHDAINPQRVLKLLETDGGNRGLIGFLKAKLLGDNDSRAAGEIGEAKVAAARLLKDAAIEAARQRVRVMVAEFRLEAESELLEARNDTLEKVIINAEVRLDRIQQSPISSSRKEELIANIELNVKTTVERIQSRSGLNF